MISEQLDHFAARDRFADLLLGILAFGDRVAGVAQCPRADGQETPEGALTDLFLGFISVRRTLGAILSLDDLDAERSARERPAGAVAVPRAPVMDLLR